MKRFWKENTMKHVRFIPIVLIVTFLMAACGTAAVPTSINPPLRIAVNLWPGLYPAAIAQEQGFFAKHNVQVEIHYYESYPQTYADLLVGKVDGLSAIVGDTLLINNQKGLKFVFPVDASDGADEFIVGSDVQSAADLKGKRIGSGFGTYGELYVRTLLKQNDIALTEITMVNSPAENAAAAFQSDVDAIHTYEPYASEALKRGGHVLSTSSDFPNLMLGTMTFPASLVKDRPQDIQAFTDAWFEAVDWMYAHPDQVPAVVAKVFGVKPEDVWFGGDKVFTRAEAKALMQPGNDYSSAYYVTQTYIDFLVASNSLTARPNPEDLIDASFLK
jgi:NitT/TauT family transport system substrate-binding protein